MGAKLVGDVLMKWSAHLSDRGFRLLVRMAHTALDEPKDGKPASVYFGGRDLLVATLRADARRGKQDTVFRIVRTVLDELIQMGAIERTNSARSGANQAYRLTLNKKPRIDADRPSKPSRSGKKGVFTTPPQEGLGTPPQEVFTTPVRGGSEHPPRNQEEPVEEKYQEEVKIFAGLSPSARASPPDEHGFIPPPQCGYPECSRGWIIPSDPNEMPHQCPRCNSNVIPFPDRRTA